MPKAWSEKDERQYQQIKDSLLDKGKPEEQAKEIAARIVNKQRNKEGRTPNKKTQGTGNPHQRLEQRTRDELYNRAKQLNIKNRSSMNKQELIAAIRAHS